MGNLWRRVLLKETKCVVIVARGKEKFLKRPEGCAGMEAQEAWGGTSKWKEQERKHAEVFHFDTAPGTDLMHSCTVLTSLARLGEISWHIHSHTYADMHTDTCVPCLRRESTGGNRSSFPDNNNKTLRRAVVAAAFLFYFFFYLAKAAQYFQLLFHFSSLWSYINFKWHWIGPFSRVVRCKKLLKKLTKKSNGWNGGGFINLYCFFLSREWFIRKSEILSV